MFHGYRSYRIALWVQIIVYCFWYVGFGLWAYDSWIRGGEAVKASLRTNLIIAALFGIPALFKIILDYVSARRVYYYLDKSGSDIFRFVHLAEFVANHAKTMEGTLYFYNIPLQTFYGDNFRNIWVQSVAANPKIKEVRILLDMSLAEKWQDIVHDNSEFFAAHPTLFSVKLAELRRDSLLSDPAIPARVREILKQILPFSYVNFGVWMSHDPQNVGQDLVTMTAEGIPWGYNGVIQHFLAVTQVKVVCNDIRNFVTSQYDSAPGPELTYVSR